MVVELEEIIKLENSNPKYYSLFMSKINNFESQNDDVTRFLKEDAISYCNSNRAKTFLLLGDDTGDLLGYFTLAVKSVEYRDKITNSLRNRIAGHSTSEKIAAFYLIGQLGRDKNLSKKGFGKNLLDTALLYLIEAQSIIGLRYCLVETEPTESNNRVVDFYEDNGFIFLQIDKKDKYKQMIAIVKHE